MNSTKTVDEKTAEIIRKARARAFDEFDTCADGYMADGSLADVHGVGMDARIRYGRLHSKIMFGNADHKETYEEWIARIVQEGINALSSSEYGIEMLKEMDRSEIERKVSIAGKSLK